MDPELTSSTRADYPLNAWYAVARDVELRYELLARKVCDTRVVVYRRRDGVPVALEDCCWHRMLPLSKGSLRRPSIGRAAVSGWPYRLSRSRPRSRHG